MRVPGLVEWRRTEDPAGPDGEEIYPEDILEEGLHQEEGDLHQEDEAPARGIMCINSV